MPVIVTMRTAYHHIGWKQCSDIGISNAVCSIDIAQTTWRSWGILIGTGEWPPCEYLTRKLLHDKLPGSWFAQRYDVVIDLMSAVTGRLVV